VHADFLKKSPSVSEGATSNDITVQVSNLLSEKEDKEEKQTTRMGPLTFDIDPGLKEDKHNYLAAVDNQAELMCWHYCVGHLAFSKLKQLALSGKISQRLAKVKPPACAGCFFGAMTKVSRKGQETSSKLPCTVAPYDGSLPGLAGGTPPLKLKFPPTRGPPDYSPSIVPMRAIEGVFVQPRA
jgi:hypothetical protein